jgi:hypothetical protein
MRGFAARHKEPFMFREARGLALAALLLATAGLAGSCAKTPTDPSVTAQLTADDIATQVGVSASNDNGGMMAEYDGLVSSVPNSPPTAPSRRSPPITHVVSTDTTFTSGNLTFTISRVFYSGANALAGWDTSATSVVGTAWVHGSVTAERFTATIGRGGSLTVNGIHYGVDTLVVDGAGHDTTNAHVVSLDGQHSADFHMLASRTLAAVRVLKNRTSNPWPLSGTATWVISVDKLRGGPNGQVETHVDATVVVTFNGTQNPTVVVNGNYHYTLDLASDAIARI